MTYTNFGAIIVDVKDNKSSLLGLDTKRKEVNMTNTQTQQKTQNVGSFDYLTALKYLMCDLILLNHHQKKNRKKYQFSLSGNKDNLLLRYSNMQVDKQYRFADIEEYGKDKEGNSVYQLNDLNFDCQKFLNIEQYNLELFNNAIYSNVFTYIRPCSLKRGKVNQNTFSTRYDDYLKNIASRRNY